MSNLVAMYSLSRETGVDQRSGQYPALNEKHTVSTNFTTGKPEASSDCHGRQEVEQRKSSCRETSTR